MCTKRFTFNLADFYSEMSIFFGLCCVVSFQNLSYNRKCNIISAGLNVLIAVLSHIEWHGISTKILIFRVVYVKHEMTPYD
jgi:hypothetical protein